MPKEKIIVLMKNELFSRLLMIIGGTMALVFGLLTAFIPGLAYVKVWVYNPSQIGPDVVYFPLDLHIHVFTLGSLASGVGGLLGLAAALVRVNRQAYLSFAGSFMGNCMGFLGFLFLGPQGSFTMMVHYLWLPWVGVCLTLVGVSLMFVGTVVESRGWHRLTLLGVPFLLVSWLMYPILTAFNNLPLLCSIYRNMSINVVLGCLMISGFVLTFSGTLIGFLKSVQN